MAGNMDERVVSMEFDNKSFERNVKTSMKTIDDLKESLDFDKTGKSFDEVSEKFRQFGKENVFRDVDSSVNSLRMRMALLGDSAGNLVQQFAQVTKITALFQMAEHAVNSLKNSIKSFTIAPISQGFDKYATKISSIKTISNATGMAADDVDKSLERLNWFTDETSASFESMVSNIGKFTSVGKGLDESITAMQGIATWGYHSGATVAEQTRAMYNLSQALGTGSVKLIDWKSIENAGMATKEFKEQAIAAAEAAGTLKRKGDKLFAGNQEVSVENFNATLSKGWFSSDVLMDTLKEYGEFADKVRKYQEEHPQYQLASEAMAAMDAEREAKEKELMDELDQLINKGDAKSDAEQKAVESQADVAMKKIESSTKMSKKDIDLYIKSLQKLGQTDVERARKEYEEFKKKYKLDDETMLSAYGNNLFGVVEGAADIQAKLAAKEIGTAASKTKKSSKEIYEEVKRINKINNAKEREKEIKKFASELQIDVKQATKLLDQLADCEEKLGEKAFKSSQEAKTFEEAIEATKDAVSTGWMNTFQHIFGGLEKSKELWTDVTEILWDLFAAGAQFRNNALLHWAEEFNGWADLWNADEEKGPLGALRNIMNVIIDLKELLGSSFKNVFFPELARVTGVLYDDEDEQVAVKNGLKTTDQIRNYREGNVMGAKLKNVTRGIREFTAKINAFFTDEVNQAKITTIFTSIATVVKFATSVIGNFFSSISNFATKTGIFQDILNVLAKISEKITTVFDKLEKSGFIKKVFDNISNSFVWIYTTIKRWIDEIKQFLDETGIGQAIQDFFNGILEFFIGGENDVDENGQKMESGFFRAFDWLKDVKAWFDGINLKQILYDVKSFIDNFGTLWGVFTSSATGQEVDTDKLVDNGLPATLKDIADKFKDVGSKISNVVIFFRDTWSNFTGWLETSGVLPKLREWWEGIKTIFANIGLIWEVFTTGKVADPKKLDKKQKDIVYSILTFKTKIQKALNDVKGWFSTAWTWIQEKWNSLVEWLESSGILPKIRQFGDTVKTVFENLGVIWEVFSGILSGKSPMEVLRKHLMVSGKESKLTGLQKILINVSNFAMKIRTLIAKVKKIFDDVWKWIQEKWSLFTGWLESSGILPKIREIWDKVKIFFGNFGEIWSQFKDAIAGGKFDKDALKDSGMDDGLINVIETVRGWGEGIHNAIEWVKEKWNDVVNWLETSGILPTLRQWWSDITGWFDNAAKDIESNGVFSAVSTFFTDLWTKITGLFGGGEQPKDMPEAPSVPVPENAGGGGFLDGFLSNFKNKEGNFDLIKGISNGVTGLFDLIGQINWSGISSSIFGIMVDVINGLNDACGDLKIDNIVRVIKQIVGAFSVAFITKAISDLMFTIRTIAKKGKEKSMLEKFTDFLASLGQALLKIGIAVALIAGSMWLISQIPKDRFGAASVVMAFIGAFLIAFMVIAYVLVQKMGKDANKLAKSFEAIGNMFLKIALSVAIMVAAIFVVAMMLQSGVNIWAAFGVIAAVLGLMGLLIVLVGQLTKNTGAVKIEIAIATFAGIAILLATCVAAILLLQNVDPGKAFIVIGEITALFAVITGMIVVLSKCVKKFNPKMLVGMITMAVMLGLVVAAFLLLKDADGGNLLKIAGAIAGIMVVLIGAIWAMDKLGPGAIKGAAILAAVLIIIATSIAVSFLIVAKIAASAMDSVLSFMSTLAAVSNSAKIVDLDAITNAMGALPIILDGLLAVAFASVSTASAIKLADDAWTVFVKLGNASTAAQMVDKKQFDKIFGSDGKSGILQMIQTGLSGITDTGWKAASLGTHVEQLSESLKLVGQAGLMLNKEWEEYGNQTYAQGIQNVKDRLTDIQSIVEMATSMGTTGEGENMKQIDLTTFSEGIANIGAALELYNKALASFEDGGANGADTLSDSDVAPISTENISAALQSVMGALKDVTFDSSEVGAIEGWAGLNPAEGGSGTLFALGLTNIANAMGTFSTAAKDFDNSNVNNAISSLGTLADIHGKVTNPAQYKSTIDGITTWGDSGSPDHKGSFANAISSMGTAMAAFGQSVKNIPSNAVNNATTALQTLTGIYTELNGHEEVITYFDGFGVKIQGLAGSGNKSVDEVFTDFGTGIGKLASALVTFGKELNIDGYEPEKVKQAVEIIKDMKQIQTDLQGVDTSQNFWDKLVFGPNDLNKLKNGMAGLGSRLKTFSDELGGENFKIDVNGSNWKNISGVITFFKEIWTDLATMTDESRKFDEATGMMTEYSGTTGYTLEDLANGINKIREAVIEFNKAMTEVRDVKGNDAATFTLGEWSSSAFENIKALITFVKDISVDMKNAGLENGNFYNIGSLGEHIRQMFGALNDSDVADFLGKLENFESLTQTLKTLTESNGKEFSGKGFNLAAELITGFASRLTSTEVTDGKTTLVAAFAALLAAIAGYATDFYTKGSELGTQFSNGFEKKDKEKSALLDGIFTDLLTSIAGFEQQFFDKGKALGEKFAAGFKNERGYGPYELINRHSEFVTAITGTLDSIVAEMDKYLEQYEARGKSAGTAYARGFKSGTDEAGLGSLSPVISMDFGGQSVVGISAILTQMGYAKSTDILTVVSRLDDINTKLGKTIKVDDSHGTVLSEMNTKLTKLDNLNTLKTDVSSLKTDIQNLKVYIDSKTLVGAIGPQMDEYLGGLTNVSP